MPVRYLPELMFDLLQGEAGAVHQVEDLAPRLEDRGLTLQVLLHPLAQDDGGEVALQLSQRPTVSTVPTILS